MIPPKEHLETIGDLSNEKEVLLTTVRNFGTYHEVKERLKALQDYVNTEIIEKLRQFLDDQK